MHVEPLSDDRILVTGRLTLLTLMPAVDHLELVREDYGGEPYEFYPLGVHVVMAPAVCGGRPTFKYTRIEARFILERLAGGETIDELVDDYADSGLSVAAIEEALHLAAAAFARATTELQTAG
jgi:uncharacterized protein (DUF433 family)